MTKQVKDCTCFVNSCIHQRASPPPLLVNMLISHALILGIVQGLTEFLPISSSAHLILVPKLFGWGDSPLVFDTSLHLGTALAVLIYFGADYLKMDKKTFTYILVGSIPVMLVGFLFGDFIEETFRSAMWVSVFLFVGSAFMYLAETSFRHYSGSLSSSRSGTIASHPGVPQSGTIVSHPGVPQSGTIGSRSGAAISLKNSLTVGVAQVFSLLPGISRSGVTISAGLMLRFSREEAARFSFLLSMPAVLAAGGYKLLTTFSGIKTIGFLPFGTGVVASAIVGILTINYLLKFLKTNSLYLFIVYRVILVILILILL